MLHNVHGKSNSLRTHHWWALYIRNSTVPILSLLHSSNLIHVWIPFLNWDKSHWASHMVTKQLNDEEILIWSLWIRHAREPQVSVNCEFLHAPSNCLTQNSKSVPCENRPPPTMTELMHLQKQTTCSLLQLHGDCYLWRQLTGKMQSRPWKVKGQPRTNLGQFLCLGPFTANKRHTLILLHNQRKPLTCSPVEKAEWKIRPFPQPRQLPRGTWALILQHVTTGDGHGHGHRGLCPVRWYEWQQAGPEWGGAEGTVGEGAPRLPAKWKGQGGCRQTAQGPGRQWWRHGGHQRVHTVCGCDRIRLSHVLGAWGTQRMPYTPGFLKGAQGAGPQLPEGSWQQLCLWA